jgi:hypothetical protein
VNEYAQPIRDVFWLDSNVSLAGYSNGVHSYLPYGYMTTEFPPESNYEGYIAQVDHYVLRGPCTASVDEELLSAVNTLHRAGWSRIGYANNVAGLAASGGTLWGLASDWSLWTRPATPVLIDWERIEETQPIVALAADRANLYAATRDGRLLMRPATTNDWPWIDIGYANNVRGLAVLDGVIYAAASDPAGDRLWMRTAESEGGHDWTDIGEAENVVTMAATAGRIYAVSTDQHLWWREAVPERRPWRRVLSANNAVALAAADSRLYLSTNESDQPLWTLDQDL